MPYMAFEDFCSYKRTTGVNINDFLILYEFLSQKLRKFGVSMQKRVQVFFILNTAIYPKKTNDMRNFNIYSNNRYIKESIF